MTDRPLRVLFACPAYWPALAFGGPIWMARELNGGLVKLGHSVEVVTTTLTSVDAPGDPRTRVRDIDGVRVTYLATPLRYRWMGITPTLPLWLARHPAARPDVAHVFGFRDVVTTVVAEWCRLRRVPYVFEPLGMFRPKLRKVRFKRVFDATVARGVASGAAAIVATSRFEQGEIVAAGGDPANVVIRGNGFPAPEDFPPATGRLRRELGTDGPIVLYVGRIAGGKGIDLLLDAVRALPDVHLVLAGPDDAHGVMADVRRAQATGRVHVLNPGGETRPFELYREADAFVLASEGESFGMVAAEAAAAGTPVVVTDRCGVADFLGGGGALVVPYDRDAVRDAIARVLGDEDLRRRLSAGGQAVARSLSWSEIVRRQEEIYRRAISGRRARGGRARAAAFP